MPAGGFLAASVVNQEKDGTWRAVLPWFFDLIVTAPAHDLLEREIISHVSERMRTDMQALQKFQIFMEEYGEEVEFEPPDPASLKALERFESLTDANFDTQIAAYPLVLVDFWASWCKPCLGMAPALEKFADEVVDKLHIFKIDNDKHRAIAERFNVKSIPTLILFEKGEERERLVGAHSKSMLMQKLLSYLTKDGR